MRNKLNDGDVADLSEPFIDQGSKQLLQEFTGEALPELAQEIPLAKTILAVGKVFSNAKDYHRTKMLLSFIRALEKGEKSIEDFSKLPEKDKASIRGLVISQLDMQSDDRQAEAIAHLFHAYISKKISRTTFTGILSEIKNTNPLLYSKEVNGIYLRGGGEDELEATGPTELLPPVFGHNTVTGIGQWDSTGEYKFVLTDMGLSFIEHVYRPMFAGENKK